MLEAARWREDCLVAGSVGLAAEVLWVIYLILASHASAGAAERLHIRKVFGGSGAEIPDNHWALGDVLEQGVAHPGTANQTHRWRCGALFEGSYETN